MFTRIKICCIASPEEARLAIDAGANVLGLVSKMPSGPGPIDDATIARIVASLPDPAGVETFLLTSRTNGPSIVEQLRLTGCSAVQICDALDSPDDYATIRAALPRVKIVQVIHVEDEASLDEAFHAQKYADELLLDSGRPKAAIKELGGTGRAHDWTLSHRIVGASSVPVWLAGGLNAGNVAKAIRDVRPFGIDICTGVRNDGRLDPLKLRDLVKAARHAEGS